jgi:thiol-disulfide isomerase/thioredoxin
MKNPTLKIFAAYLVTLLLMLASGGAFSQIKAVHFNAGWNSSNGVEWFGKLGDCDKNQLLIEDGDNQKKYQIAIVPTIVIFDDGEEVKRFQADLSFKMSATRQEVQDYIDEIIMSKF